MQTKHSSSCEIAKILAQYRLTSYMNSNHAILCWWYHVVLSPDPLRWLLIALLSSLPRLLLRHTTIHGDLVCSLVVWRSVLGLKMIPAGLFV